MPSSTSIKPAASARNLCVIFDSNLPFSDPISKTCFAHIRDLIRFRNTLDHTIACNIATRIHFKLEICNSLFLNLNCQQINRLQLILNSAARAVTKTPKYNHITPHLKSLLLLKITQRIQYWIFSLSLSLSLAYKSRQFNQPFSILDLLKINPLVHPQLLPSNVLPFPLGSKLLTNPSTTKLLLSGFTTQISACLFFNVTYTQTSNSLLSLSSSLFPVADPGHLVSGGDFLGE